MIGVMFLAVFVYTFAVYGISWIITQSYLLQPIRDFTEKIAHPSHYLHPVYLWNARDEKYYFLLKPFIYLAEKVNYLLNCIVCTSVWVGLCLANFMHISPFFRHSFPPVHTVWDYVIWGGYSAATAWTLATLLGDAD